MKLIYFFCFVYLFSRVESSDDESLDLSDLTAEHWIQKLSLTPQPRENGSYVSNPDQFGSIASCGLPDTYPPEETRPHGTWSYFLLEGSNKEYFTKSSGYRFINHVRGRIVNVYVLDPNNGKLTKTTIGPRGSTFVVVVPAGFYMAMRLKRPGATNPYALVTMLAIPGEESSDVQLFHRANMPKGTSKLDRRIVRKLTYSE